MHYYVAVELHQVGGKWCKKHGPYVSRFSSVEKAETLDEAITEALQNLADDFYTHNLPTVFPTGQSKDGKAQYVVGVTVSVETTPCNLYRLDGKEDIWAPDPKTALEFFNDTVRFLRSGEEIPVELVTPAKV
jgi:hypothetical protein